MNQSPSVKLAAQVLRVLVLALPVLLVFAASVVLVALGLSWVRGVPLIGRENLLLGVICGLIIWLFFASFHVRRETLRLPTGDRAAFFARLVPLLEELGYEVKWQGADRLVSRPSFRSLLFGGGLQVEVDGGGARVTGPKVFVEILRHRLRLHSHLSRAHQDFREPRVRPGDRLLKRVEISVRFRGGDSQGVCEEVVQALLREGAEVVGELHLFAQSEAGIREQTVEDEIRERLKQRHLAAEIRKDHPRWDEPPLPEEAPADVTPAPPRYPNLLGKGM
jgi:hypothetical protein